MVACVTDDMKYCMVGYFPTARIEKTINVSLSIYKKANSEEVLCGTSSYKVPYLVGGVACKKEFYDKMRIEINTFYDQFRQNRGDPALCNKFHKVQQRLIKRLQSDMCSPEVWKTVNQTPIKDVISFNPYCAKGQSPALASNAWRLHSFLYGIISMLFITVYFI